MESSPPTATHTRNCIIHMVPNEIWAEILKISLPTMDRCGAGVYQPSSSVIVAMSQVCSKWRNIAIATSSLWTRIYFQIEGRRNYPHEDLVSLWLERASSQYLYVRMVIWSLDRPASHPTVRNCLLDLLATIPRWRVGYLEISPVAWDIKRWYSFEPYINVSAPLLESLSLQMNFAGGEEGVISLPDKLWMSSPCHLTKLFISLIGATWALPDYRNPSPESCLTRSQIPYAQLTHLRLETHRDNDFDFAFAWEHILTILSRTPNLVSCFLRGVRNSLPGIGFTGLAGPAFLQHLQHMYIEAGATFHSFPGAIDRVLICPSLEELTISSTRNWDQTSFTRFIKQSSCLLRRLSFVDVKLAPEDFLECMRLSPSLTAIHLHDIDCIADYQVCRMMTDWKEASGCFSHVPTLHYLSLTRDPLSQYVTKNYEGVEKMLKTRLRPPNGSRNYFTTLAIPLSKRRLASAGLEEVCRDPWNLKVFTNDNLYTVDNLWDKV